MYQSRLKIGGFTSINFYLDLLFKKIYFDFPLIMSVYELN
jgi:hypothetical protein